MRPWGARYGARARGGVLLGALAAGLGRGRAVHGQGAAMPGPDGRLGAVEAFRAGETPLAYEAGVRWERVTFWWRGLQAGPGAPLNPFYLPFSYVDQERANGVQVVGLLVNTPEWAAADPARGGTSPPKGLYRPHNHPENYWGQFVRRVVELYKGRIDTWIIWNEPDITPDAPNAAYYLWSGSPADYYQLLRVAYLSAKEVHPGAQILSAAVTYWTDIHMLREQWFSRFLDAVGVDPTAGQHNQDFDACAVNLYTNPQNLYTVPTLYHQLMRERGFDKPIWITETNVIPYDDPVNAGSGLDTPAQMRATLEEQANYVLQALAMGLAAGVHKIAVYKMKDGDGDVVNGQALLRADNAKRPAYDAFRVAAQYFSHFDRATLYAPGDLRQVVFDSVARRVTVLWSAAPEALDVHVPAAGDGQGWLGGPNGDFRPLGARNGVFALRLAGATMHTDLENPSVYLIGGAPVVLVEVDPRRPAQPAHNLSPATLPPFQPVAARRAGEPGSGSLPL